MATDQLRKRSNGAPIVECNSRGQHKAKKKNVGVNQDDPATNPHISLEWDSSLNTVVAKRDQIGISWNNIKPYIDPIFTNYNIPADIFDVPHGIYDLKSLENVLSYEVWQTHLSENERSHLMQFLPRGSDGQQVVKALLTGECFHFGNPFAKWGTSLCSGNFHPDVILRQDHCLMADKKVYHKELQKYHNDLIAYLLKLKEGYAGCDDPEEDFLEKIWRSRKDKEKHSSSHANGSRFCDLDENATPTSESGSWVADDKACCSDKQISSVTKGVKLQNRLYEEGFLKDKNRIKVLTEDDALYVGAAPKKEDKLHQGNNIYSNDGSPYMSYVKISKKQYETVKSMKQSSKSIQFKSLNRVLGNDCNIQPYHIFVEEEQKNLHKHWLQLARNDLPVAYEIWMEMRLRRRKLTASLETNMKERLESVMEGRGNENDSMLQDELEPGKHESTIHEDEKSVPDLQQGEDFCMEEEKSLHFSDGHNCNIKDLDSEKQFCIESDNKSEKDIRTGSESSQPNFSVHSGNQNLVGGAVSQEARLCSSGEAWKAVCMPLSYHDSTANHEFVPVSELSVTLPQVNEQCHTHILDVVSDYPVGNMGNGVLHGQSDNASFSSYPNQDRSELLQSVISYPLQKQAGLDFQPPNNVFMGNGQIPLHFEEQQHLSLPLGLGQNRANGLYMNPQYLTESIFPDGGRYLIPRQECHTPVNFQSWSASSAGSVRMLGPPQSDLRVGNLSGQNWFSSEHPVNGGWPGSSAAAVTNYNNGTGSSVDESLFGALSHCNQLRSGNPYQPVGSADQYISPSRNYGIASGVAPRIGNVVPQAGQALDYLGSSEATPMMPDYVQWMNLPHQNSGLRDPMSKTFLRSWNQ